MKIGFDGKSLRECEELYGGLKLFYLLEYGAGVMDQDQTAYVSFHGDDNICESVLTTLKQYFRERMVVGKPNIPEWLVDGDARVSCWARDGITFLGVDFISTRHFDRGHTKRLLEIEQVIVPLNLKVTALPESDGYTYFRGNVVPPKKLRTKAKD